MTSQTRVDMISTWSTLIMAERLPKHYPVFILVNALYVP